MHDLFLAIIEMIQKIDYDIGLNNIIVVSIPSTSLEINHRFIGKVNTSTTIQFKDNPYNGSVNVSECLIDPNLTSIFQSYLKDKTLEKAKILQIALSGIMLFTGLSCVVGKQIDYIEHIAFKEIN
jgi:hypothetical protein